MSIAARVGHWLRLARVVAAIPLREIHIFGYRWESPQRVGSQSECTDPSVTISNDPDHELNELWSERGCSSIQFVALSGPAHRPSGRDKARQHTVLSEHATAAEAFAAIDRMAAQMVRTGARSDAIELVVVDTVEGRVIQRPSAH